MNTSFKNKNCESCEMTQLCCSSMAHIKKKMELIMIVIMGQEVSKNNPPPDAEWRELQ